MQTVFILAGFDLHDTASSTDYSRLRKGLKRKDYNIVPVDISWYHKTPSKYVKEFIYFYEQHKTNRNIIIGNSFGAVIAFLSAPTLKPDELYLCSLSPFFKEDRHKRPDNYAIRYFGKRRMEDLWSYSADAVASDISQTTTKTFVLYGQKEHVTSPLLVARCKDTASKIKRASLTEIANAPHDMSNSVYSDALIAIVSPA
jgi:pimeloyl-ACP methyl ester carboxylesterase